MIKGKCKKCKKIVYSQASEEDILCSEHFGVYLQKLKKKRDKQRKKEREEFLKNG